MICFKVAYFENFYSATKGHNKNQKYNYEFVALNPEIIFYMLIVDIQILKIKISTFIVSWHSHVTERYRSDVDLDIITKFGQIHHAYHGVYCYLLAFIRRDHQSVGPFHRFLHKSHRQNHPKESRSWTPPSTSHLLVLFLLSIESYRGWLKHGSW